MKTRWKSAAFADAPFQIIDGDRGSNYPKQSDYLDAGFCLFLNTGNVTKSGFDFGAVQFVDEAKDNALRKGKLIRDDIVLTTRGTIGNVAHYHADVPFDCMRINSGMVILRCDKNRISSQFLYHFLRSPSFLGQTNSLRSGAAQPQLPIRDIKQIQIPLPSLAEQLRVADVLSAYDELMENNRRRMELLEESARLLYREWFVRLRYPGHEHGSLTNGIPVGWTKGKVGDFYGTASGGTPSRNNPEYFTGEIPWVKTQELLNGFITETQEHITEAGVKNSAAKLFPAQSVLVALYGATVGELGILSIPAATNQACCALFPKDSRAHYIHAFLFLQENKEKLVNLSAGAAQKNISQQIIRGYEMVMPSKRLLDSFIETLNPVFDQCLNLHQQNQKHRAARDLLLPRLMSGEITL